jgi:hypothetical protein
MQCNHNQSHTNAVYLQWIRTQLTFSRRTYYGKDKARVIFLDLSTWKTISFDSLSSYMTGITLGMH